jgi:penicillin-binding protein 1C
MASSPRPIGSTVKPFIYLKAFEKGLRPYTLADDREYRYPIGTGFPLYPKNYDYTYHGIVTLHEALSNSYNVPAVKTLEYIGTDNFANFLRTDLNFKPIQPLENYALGIALGELEMPS